MLYTENLLVRANSIRKTISAHNFEFAGVGYSVPILACGEHAKQFRYHIMEISMLREHEPYLFHVDEMDFSETCLIFASDDLPRFCWVLLKNRGEWLSQLTLAVEIRHDNDVSTLQGRTSMDTRTDLGGDANIEYGFQLEDQAATGDTVAQTRTWNSSKTTDFQIRRLLEPFRSLHSLQGVHIEGPLAKGYKSPLIASMCAQEPSDEELFDTVYAGYEDAILTYETGDLSSAVNKMKNILDVMKDYKEIGISGIDEDFPPWDAFKPMRLTLWRYLGWASLSKRGNHTDVWKAYRYVQWILVTYVSADWENQNIPPMGHEIAMVFFLWAKVWEALDDLGEHDTVQRSDCLKEIIFYIEEGLRHEPGNGLLTQKLMKRKNELQNARYIKDLMEMSDCIHEREDFAPGRGRGDWRGRGRGRG